VTLALSALDQSPIRQGGVAADAFAETIALAKACDRWGYRRYWLAEHHNTRSFAGSSPEVLIPRVAAETQRIRVGSGGIMLPHYSPLKVAENFRILETLYPGRIDLGLGRAPGGDQITAAALQAGPKAWGIETFPQQVNLLRHYLEESAGAAEWPADHPYRHVHAMPRGPGLPQMWMLGSTAYGGILAAELGLPFCYAHFISREDDGPDICAAYRERFKPRQPGDRPHVSVCVFVLAAETDAEAERLSMTRNLWVMQLLANQAGGFPPPDAARERSFSDAETTLMTRIASRGIAGEPARVKDGILKSAETYGADEFFCLTITYDFADRLRSYELIAQAFDLI
jgi:luciferase family oxidoreductase group 1